MASKTSARWVMAPLMAGLLLMSALAAVSRAQSAPDFSLKDTGGRPYSLSQFRGKVVVLNFITYLCKPCREEMPYLNQIDQEMKGQGVQVIGMGLASTAEQLRTMAQQVGVSYPMLVAPDNIAKAYGNVEFVPVTFIVGRQGNIVKKLNGPQTKEDFIKAIKSAL